MTHDIKTALNDIKNDLFEIWKYQTETTLCNSLKDTGAKIDNLIAKLDLRVYTGGYWTAHDIHFHDHIDGTDFSILEEEAENL